MNQTEQILSQLRDIQVPPAPEGVSLWLIAANLALLLIVLTGLYIRWLRERERWRRDALRQVRHARSLEPATAVLALAKLLRQIMLYRQYDISKGGFNWLASLDEAFDTHWFTQAEGQAFGGALYKRSVITDAQLRCLCNHLDRLIRKLPARRQEDTQLPDRRSTP